MNFKPLVDIDDNRIIDECKTNMNDKHKQMLKRMITPLSADKWEELLKPFDKVRDLK